MCKTHPRPWIPYVAVVFIWSLRFAKAVKWVNNCCLTPCEKLFSYIMERTSYILMRWCPLYISLLKQQSAGRHITPSGHIILILSQLVFLLLLLNIVCLAGKQQIPIYSLTRLRLEPMVYVTQGKHAYHINTTNAFLKHGFYIVAVVHIVNHYF